MLSKLIKYDIKSTYRDFLGIYFAILLCVTIVPLIFNNVRNEIINMIAGFVAFGIFVAVIVVVIINIFQIFNTNLFSKQGYLTMTLPVTSRDIVFSKLIVSSMWIVLTGIVSFIALSIFVLMITSTSYTAITDAFHLIMAQLNTQHIFTLILLILTVIISCVKEMAKLFLSCSIAHLKQFNHFRVPAGILSYFVFSWLETLIVQIIFLVFGNLFTNSQELIAHINTLSDLNGMNQDFELFNAIIGSGIIYGLLLASLFSTAIVWILNHKLDLD